MQIYTADGLTRQINIVATKALTNIVIMNMWFALENKNIQSML
jgi:hypothetical protein